jgi:hypothetical protein
VPRRTGSRSTSICYYIDKAWWPEFQGGRTTIAATSFLRINLRNNIKGNHSSVWLQEMKVPPLGEKEILRSATVLPMLSSEWQAKQDPDIADLQTDGDMFLWDGEFVANEAILGGWTVIDEVNTIDEFTTDKRLNPGRPTFTEMTFNDRGRTEDRLRIWSGDVLMDLKERSRNNVPVYGVRKMKEKD